MNQQIRLFVFVTLLVAITLPASYAAEKDPRPAWESYSEFGVTFKYPPELNLKAADTATAEEGSIKARENGKLLHLRWMRGISGKQSIEKVLSSYIRSRAPRISLGREFYLGESKWLKVHNQQRAFARFYTSDERGIFLNVAYAWHAEDSNRTFVLCCGAAWEHPVIVTDGKRFLPEWPKLDDDPSYNFCQSVLKSFKDKAPVSLNCLKIKYLDLSERLIYYWSFRYDYREYDSPPPERKAYSYIVHRWWRQKEKMSHTLYLISWGRFAERRRVQILSDEIDRFRMKWKKTTEGNLERTSLLLLTIDGRTFELDNKAGKYWAKDVSPFADNDKYPSNIHVYIVGKEGKNDQLIDYSLNLSYDRSILFGHDPSKIPVEIAVIKTESGTPNRPETELPKEDISPTVSVEQIEQEPVKEDTLPKATVCLEEKLYKQTKIAFTSVRDGNPEIYVMNADGSEQKRLTNNSATDASPSWSPHGKKIAFASEKDGNPEIYIMNADGSEQERLTNNPASDGFPSWSPDGKKIAFQSTRDGNGEIYLMNANGSDQKRLTNNPANDGFPSWSPDGKKIAFRSSRDDGNDEIYVMNADGSEQKRLTNTPASNSHPSWSPDGRKIAFNSYRDGNPEIYVMNQDGSEQRNLTNNSTIDGAPSWSPNGKKIAFTSRRDGNLEIYIMNADGSEQKRLTSNPAWDMSSFWSPFLGSEKSASALGVVKGRPDANEQGAKNYLKIKYLDLSERLIYDWSFRYFYLEYDSPPPKGYWYSLHGRENEKEKMSHTLYLINEGRRVQLLSDQIDRFRMKWKKRKIPSQREEGNLERTSLLLLTIDGRTFELDYKTDKYWKKDISSFADKDKYHTNIHLYIVGKERKNDQLIDYSLNLGYDRSILFGHDPSKIPVEIAVIKTESGTPNSSESLRLHKQIKKNLK